MNLNPAAIPAFLLSFGLFCLGYYLAGRVRSRTGRLALFVAASLLAVPGCLFVVYYAHLFDRARWFYQFRSLPHSELAASGLGLMAGVLHCTLRPQTFGERLIAPLTLAVLMFVPFVKSALDPVDYAKLRGSCVDEVCLQSTPSTCGPTSAATLLRMVGQNASEKELARECFTYRGGTEIWYVARALRKRGMNVDFVIQRPDAISPPAPAIAGVVLRGGAGHFVAVIDETRNEITIGDPLSGKHVIRRSEIGRFYEFTGFFLVIHPGSR